MADVITSQPQSVAVAAAPQRGVATRKYAVEAIGAFFLTFAVGVAALSGSVFVPLAAGAMLMVMIYAGGHISGGHYNPAVTLAALVRRRIGIRDAVAYWVVQVAGGVIAGLLARAVVNQEVTKKTTPALWGLDHPSDELRRLFLTEDLVHPLAPQDRLDVLAQLDDTPIGKLAGDRPADREHWRRRYYGLLVACEATDEVLARVGALRATDCVKLTPRRPAP